MERNEAAALIYDDKAREMIKKHEGYRSAIYLDSVGVPTGGWGHAFLTGSTLPLEIWKQIFEIDFEQHRYDADVFINQHCLFDIGEARRVALIDLCFNLGLAKLNKFRATIKALREKDYDLAATNLLNSLWATQVGGRASDIALIIRRGVLQ